MQVSKVTIRPCWTPIAVFTSMFFATSGLSRNLWSLSFHRSISSFMTFFQLLEKLVLIGVVFRVVAPHPNRIGGFLHVLIQVSGRHISENFLLPIFPFPIRGLVDHDMAAIFPKKRVIVVLILQSWNFNFFSFRQFVFRIAVPFGRRLFHGLLAAKESHWQRRMIPVPRVREAGDVV